jgi:fido (protein-threonine AMPylation protein)
MTGALLEQDDASTPLSPNERDGLIPSYITLRGELNEAEQANILDAETWAFSRKRNVLGETFLNTLHKRMYGNVWRWAGQHRFHHRLVSIHCYPNGNGRHARLAADLLLKSLGRDRFSWGSATLVDAGQTRARYVAALKAADIHDIGPLLAFVRS